jgi:hypothetical protein
MTAQSEPMVSTSIAVQYRCFTQHCRLILLALFAMVAAFAMPITATATTYYVAATGSDTNNGSSPTPFKTIQHAADLVQPGDIVLVGQGNYAGFILGWVAPTAGTAAAPITFKADPSAPVGTVVINARNNKTAVGIDAEPGCDYINVDGFTIVGGTGGIGHYPNRGSGVKMTGQFDQVTNCIVHDIDYGFGIFCDNATGVLFQGNTVYNISWGPAQSVGLGHGIYVSGNSTGAQVRSNLVHDNAYIGIHVNGEPDLVQNAVIENNIVYNNGQNALNCDGLQSSIVRNNLFYGYQNYGIVLYQIGASGPSNNNVIVNNTIVSAVAGAGAALRILNGATGNTVLNNILLGSDGNACRISSDSLPGLVSDYNVVSAKFQSEDTGATQTLAQWRTQTSHDTHSFTATAASLFVSVSGSDYHLSSTSPAIDAGTATDAPPTDLEVHNRPQGNGYDIGCYEFAGGAPPPVTLTSIALNPTSVTGGASSAGTVTLSGAAPSGGAVVSLSSSNTSAATVPGSITVAAGVTTAPFTVTTNTVSANTTVTITGTYQTVNKTATLTVNGPTAAVLSSVSVSPNSVTGGATSNGTVTLTTPAPTGGAVISLTSSASAAAVPATVTVASGATSVVFTVTTQAVTTTTTATITATYQSVSRTASLTILAPAPPPVGISVDRLVTTHQKSAGATIASPAFSTTGNSELLLAFLGSDGPASSKQTFSSVTGGGLTWRLRQRTNTQAGTSEIWQAVATGPLANITVTAKRGSGSYGGVITVVAFLGASTTVDGTTAGASAAKGAPTAMLTTTSSGSWVWGIGNDWDQAISRTVGVSQTKVDEFLASTGDTFWTQRQTNSTPTSGTAVTITDTAPTSDRWNLSLIEIVAR